MYCRRCGQQLDNIATACPNCGTPTENYNQAPVAPAEQPTNAIAIVGFVLSFVVTIAGLICSIIGFRKAKNEGYGQRGLALAGIIISSVSLGIVVFYLIMVFALLGGIYGGLLGGLLGGVTYY